MKTFLAILLTSLFSPAVSQTVIKGIVTDVKGVSIPMANIFLEGTYDGTSTDENGSFEFTTTEKGPQVLIVKFIGFKEFRRPITPDGKPIHIAVRLEEEINELDAVTISAGAFTASDESRRTVFRAIDIATTAGATADIAGALNTLPGTQKVGESGRLFVRGGDGNEARTFIDGMVVLDAYSPSAPNTPSRGRFLPFMFKGTSFSTGGYSSEYGQALSSALVLESKDETEITRTDISLLSVGGDVAQTFAWKGGSVAGKVQYTNLRPYMKLINQEIDWKTPPAEIEGVAAFRQRVGKQGMFKVYGNFNHSDFSLYRHDIDAYSNKTLYSINNNFRYLNGSYKNTLNKNWMIRGGVSYTFLANEADAGLNNIDTNEKGVHAKVVLQGGISDHVELKTGAEVINRNYSQLSSSDLSPTFSLGFNEVLTAAFAESDIYASNSFVTRLGARLEHNSLNQQVSVDPRISMAYKTGSSSQVSLAYGKFRQSAKNDYLRFDQAINPEKAAHLILNYQRLEDNRTFRVETYYKRYSDLIKFQSGDSAQVNNGGTGYAKGIELFWRDRRSVQDLDYWISYSYLDTERDYLNFPHRSVPFFVSKHNFSVVGKYFVQKLKSQLGGTYSFASGRHYNNPNQEKFNHGKTPAYHDLSINVSYLPKPYLIIHLSCTNVLGRDNIFGYEYSSTLNENGYYSSRAVRQPAPRFVFVGILITLSKDKSQTQLPTL